MNNLRIGILFTIASAALAVGCGSSNNPTPPTGDGGRGGTAAGGKGGSGGGAVAGAGGGAVAGSGGGAIAGSGGGAVAGAGGGAVAGAGGGAVAGSGGGAVAGAGGGAAGAGGQGQPGCFTGTPANGNAVQFLNRCTGNGCFPFDNNQRLPKFDGGLPPL